MALKAGDYVSWSASKSGGARGKVVSVHTRNHVPGVQARVVGSTERPAARVRVYAKSGTGWTPTETFVGMHAEKLTVIDALPEPASEGMAGTVDGSLDDRREVVEQAVQQMVTAAAAQVSPAPVYCYAWVRDFGLDWVVFSIGDSLWLVDYTLDAAGVTLGEPVEVWASTSYVTDVADGADETVVDELGEGLADVMAETVGLPVRRSIASTGRILATREADAAGQRTFRIRIIDYGTSKNLRRYPESTMRAAASKYEGAKVYNHHRTQVELDTSTIDGLVGTILNVEAGLEGLDGDLILLPSATHAAEALDQSLENQAEGLPVLVGFSHDVLARYRKVSEAGQLIPEATAIESVNSVDIVATPAAGGKATRMVAGGAGGLDPLERDPMNKQLLEAIRAADSVRRAELLRDNKATLEAAGVTAEEAVRMAEALPAPVTTTPTAPVAAPAVAPILVHVGAGAPVPATEAAPAPAAKYGRESTVGGILLREAATTAGLGTKGPDALKRLVPAEFTEADLAAAVATIGVAREGFEMSGLTPTVPHVAVTQDEVDAKKGRVDAMLAGDYAKGYRSLKEAFIDITGRAPKFADGLSEDFNRVVLHESVNLTMNGREAYFDSTMRSSESVSTATFGFILGDSITRRMVAEYSQPNLQTWRNVVSSIVPVNDFRTQRVDRMGGYGVLPAVLQGAPYQALTSPGNEEATYAITKRGGTEDMTLEAIANDDLRVIQRIPTKLGLAAAQTLFRFVWDFFNTNPNASYDSTAWFAAGHGSNTATNALSQSALSTGRKVMRAQTAYGDSSDVLSIVPATLVIVSTLEELGFQLTTSAVAIPATPAGPSNTPNLHQGLNLVVVDYWSSSTQWFLVADPNMVPTFELGFYQGRQDPELFVQADPTQGSSFNADKVTWKIRHTYSGAILDHRGVYRGNT